MTVTVKMPATTYDVIQGVLLAIQEYCEDEGAVTQALAWRDVRLGISPEVCVTRTETLVAILEELTGLKAAIRERDFDAAFELVKAADPPFLWTKEGEWLGGAFVPDGQES